MCKSVTFFSPWSSWLLYISIIVLCEVVLGFSSSCLFWNDRKISDNSVTSTNFTFNILVCLIFLPLFCFFPLSFFSSFWYHSLRVLENGQESSLLRGSGHISDYFSSNMRRQPAVQRCAIRIWHDVEGSRVSRT